jgi:hypothetical protein
MARYQEEKHKRVYAWFIESLNSHTNRVLSENLPSENAMQRHCGDGEDHDLWMCDFGHLKKFCESAIDLGIQFNIYNQEGGGQIRRCKFFERLYLARSRVAV